MTWKKVLGGSDAARNAATVHEVAGAGLGEVSELVERCS